MSIRKIGIVALLLVFVIGVVTASAFMSSQPVSQSEKTEPGTQVAQKPEAVSEQKAKIASIVQSAREEIRKVKEDKTLSEADRKAKIRAIWENAKNQIRDLLGPDYQAKLSAIKRKLSSKPDFMHKDRRRHLGFKNLTDEQKAWIRSVIETARKEIEAVKNDTSLSDSAKLERIRAIRQDARAKIKEYLKSQGIEPSFAKRKPWIGAKAGIPFAKALNLTDDQKAKIREIQRSTWEQLKALKSDQSLTPEARKAKAREIIEAGNAKIREILTPEQQQKFDELMNKIKAKRQGKSTSS
jgi:protein CpxP